MSVLQDTQKTLSDKGFYKLSEFIYKNYGIKMPESKKTMLQARLQGRLRECKFNSFEEYIDFIFNDTEGANEIIKMIDVVSTNKTDFFREPKHFEYLSEQILPKFTSQNLKIWSSAASSGEEAYTTAIVIEEYNSKNQPINYSILGTDISTRIIEKAVNAIYAEDRTTDIPFEIKKKYFLKSKDRENPKVRVVPYIRQKTQFERLNLMDNIYSGIDYDFDIIFCRNVLIYFDRYTQEKVINQLCKHLKPNGYFFLGHSESVTALNVPLKQIAPTIFIKK